MTLHHVEQVMGMAVSIDIVDADDPAVIAELVDWFHEVDETFSPYKESSTVSRIGRGEVDSDDPALTAGVVEVLLRCEQLVDETNGVFDVWSVPSPNGTNFDPCGYVKGWSVQRAADLLEASGVRRFCINAGGDIVLRGAGPDGNAWRVGIRHPDDPMALAMVLGCEGPLAVATSASYERGAHIVDPRVGSPSTELASATVIGPDLGEADAYATTLYVMGVAGLGWLTGKPGYSGCVITRDGAMLSTDEFDAHLVA